MKQPKISIIVPIYKAEDSIRRLLDSFEKQPCQDVEFFLIDNASPDKCGEICKEYVDRDSRFSLHTLEVNIGYIRARQYGIDNCTGEYVGFSDSDDYVPEDIYNTIVENINNHQPEFIACTYYAVNGDNVSRAHCGLKEGLYIDEEIKEKVMPSLFGESDDTRFLNGFMWENFYKRSLCVYNDLQFAEELKPYEDQIYNIDFVKCCSRVLALDIPVYYYIFNENSITGKNLKHFNVKDEYSRIIALHENKLKRDERREYSKYTANYLLKFIYSLLKSSVYSNKSVFRFSKSVKIIEKKYIDYILEYSNSNNMKYKITKFCLKLKAFKLFYFLITIIDKRKG